MIPDAVADLMMRVLENPHDATARPELDQLLATHPEYAPHWHDLQSTYALSFDAFAARATADTATPPPTAHTLADLHKALSTPAPTAPFWWSQLAAVAAVVLLLLALDRAPSLVPIDEATRLATNLPGDSSLRQALVAPLPEVKRATAIPTFRESTSHVQLWSPLVATSTQQLTIAWTDTVPTRLLTVELWSLGQKLREATSTASPLVWPAPPPDHVYEIRLRDPQTAQLLAREEFLFLPSGQVDAAPRDPLAAIIRAATATPSRLGDAIILWQNLPADLAATPTARRLGLWLAHEANLPSLRAQVLSR